MTETEDFQDLEYQGFSKWDSEEYEKAGQIFRKLLLEMRAIETKRNERMNKASAYYDLGLSLGFEGKIEDAARFLFLAYTEDALWTEPGKEDDADRGAAFQVLQNYYRVRHATFAKIIDGVNLAKGPYELEEDPFSKLDSEVILRNLGFPEEPDIVNLFEWIEAIPNTFTRKTQLGFPQPWEWRVFIGGNYLKQLPILNKIKDGVRRADHRYMPVVVREVDFPPDLAHHHSLLLLHTCKFAIFDATDVAGQLMEIERGRDYETKVLVLYSSSMDERDYLTAMLRTLPDVTLESYRNPDDIVGIVARFLPPIEPSTKPMPKR